MLESDINIMEILLNNLLKNAIEASPDNETILISVVREEKQHIIDFHNKGVIDESIRDRFFERYITIGKENGTGLGTYSAYLIVHTLGGEIHFTTSDSDGTHLIVQLPHKVPEK